MIPNLPSAASSCPSSAEWQDALVGRTSSERWLEIEAHMLACPRCEATVDALTEQSDTVIRNLCQGPVTAEDEPVFQSLYEKLLSSSTFSGEDQPATAAPSLPYQLGNYELLAPLGHGANGSVYRARHVALDRLVAIKLLRPDQDFDPSCVDRFLQEMRAVGSLDHPHIVRATDAGETDGQHYLTMEYVPGIDLSSVIASHGPLRPNDACEVLRQAALGLGYLHEHGFVHRDVKPSNLLLTADGQIKLLDLGLVQSVREQDDPPQGKIPHGTADYMAPEQWRAFGHVEPRSDLYSLGCTLAKLLTGAPPYRPLPAGLPTKFAAHCEAPTPDLRQRSDNVSDALEKTFERLMAKQPAARFDSANELARHLRPLSRGADLCGLARACGQQPSPGRVVTIVEPDRQWTRRQTLSAAAVVAGSALVGVPLLRRLAGQTVPRSYVRRNDWRALALAAPAVLIPTSDPKQSTSSADLWQRGADSSFIIRSPKLLLLNFGQPVVGKFRLAIDLLTPTGHSNAGLFFKYARQQNGEQLIHKFHSIELVRNRMQGADKFRLLWSAMRVVYENDILRGDRTLWAEAGVPEPSAAAPHTLEIELGSSGLPQVLWNGQSVEAWSFSEEGKHQATLKDSQLASEFLGYVGLIAGEPDTGRGHLVEPSNSSEQRITQFRSPRLSYQDESNSQQRTA